jgi:hypothetical protein
MTFIRRGLLVSLIGLGALAMSPGRAFANAQHTVRSVTRVGNGAQIRVVMQPSGAYNRFNVGITATGGRSAPQQLGQSGSAAGPTEVTINVPYGGTYRSGQQIRVISSWPAMNRIHYWGDQPNALVTLP